MTLKCCIAGAETVAGMKNLSLKEAQKILKDMKTNALPKTA